MDIKTIELFKELIKVIGGLSTGGGETVDLSTVETNQAEMISWLETLSTNDLAIAINHLNDIVNVNGDTYNTLDALSNVLQNQSYSPVFNRLGLVKCIVNLSPYIIKGEYGLLYAFHKVPFTDISGLAVTENINTRYLLLNLSTNTIHLPADLNLTRLVFLPDQPLYSYYTNTVSGLSSGFFSFSHPTKASLWSTSVFEDSSLTITVDLTPNDETYSGFVLTYKTTANNSVYCVDGSIPNASKILGHWFGTPNSYGRLYIGDTPYSQFGNPTDMTNFAASGEISGYITFYKRIY